MSMVFIKEFRGVPDGAVYPVTYQEGDKCPDELLEAAIELGAVELEDDKAKSKGKAPENKGK